MHPGSMAEGGHGSNEGRIIASLPEAAPDPLRTFVAVWEGPRMRVTLAIAAPLSLILMAGCVHGVPEGTALSVAIQPGGAHERAGVVGVRVANASSEPRCVHADILENPDTTYVSVRLRRNGRTIKPPERGFLMPPKRAGLIPLTPADEVNFDLDVFGHFSPSQLVRQEGLEARVGISSSPCSNSTIGQSQVSWSAWSAVR